MNKIINQKFFKPKARMLLLLGDQLIRDPGIAVFELVKNAYDADSPSVTVTMSNIGSEDAKIVVRDIGCGMDYETITKVWLEPGTEYRALQRERGERTPVFKRLPLGEKGVGRFAVHKLGNVIKMTTRKEGEEEIFVEIDWRDFESNKYLDQVPVNIVKRDPVIFTGTKTGTLIEINQLRHDWSRGMVREVARSINSICSPFGEKGEIGEQKEFTAKLILKDHEEWIEKLITIEQSLEYALYKAHCEIRGKNLSYIYEFIPLKRMSRVSGRISQEDVLLGDDKNKETDMSLIEDHIGPINVDLYIFDREPRILALGVTDKKGLKEFLDVNGGIRVFRDGIRVYDYGEPGNDWLDLGGRRVNIPTRRISNNIVIGAVTIYSKEDIKPDTKKNVGLIEKTNREGFVDNIYFQTFKEAISQTVQNIEAERNQDKKRIRVAYSINKIKEPVIEDLTELRRLIENKNLTSEAGPYLDRIESDFLLVRERFLTSASAGLSLSVVIHEVEKGIDELLIAVKEDKATVRIVNLAKHIAELVEGFATLIRRSGITKEQALSMVKQAIFNTQLRLANHNIKLENNCTFDFETKCSRRLTISTLMNLIDNSIFWLDNKWGDSLDKKIIYICTSNEFKDGPAIVIADNGPGFIDPPEMLIEPFFTRKADGMGLGLHIADQVMKAQGGSLIFPEEGDISLPVKINGAIVALVFGGTDDRA